jgi:hypothetical protein
MIFPRPNRMLVHPVNNRAESDSIMKFLSKNSFFEEDNSRALIIVSNSTSFDSLIPTETEKNLITMPL